MNEIEKMYENAGIKPTKNWQSCLNCELKTELRYDDWGEEYLTCKRLERPEECPNAKKYYPPFTAEKQIELIKWIAKTRPIHITFLIDKWVIEGMVRYGKRYDTFEDALSGYINSIWQDLTEEEKQQVKGILE